MWSSTLDIFAGRKIDVEIRALIGREFAEAAVEDGFGRRHQLQHDGLICGKMLFDRGDDGRQLRRQEECAEKALLASLEP